MKSLTASHQSKMAMSRMLCNKIVNLEKSRLLLSKTKKIQNSQNVYHFTIFHNVQLLIPADCKIRQLSLHFCQQNVS